MIKTHLELAAKYAGLATVVIEWSALCIYYLKMPLYFGGKYPISYFATLPETRWIFSICYILAAICFWIFVKHHLAKYYGVPLKIFAVSLFLFAAMGIFPYDPHNFMSDIIHKGLALSSGLSFVLGMYLIARSAADKMLFRFTTSAIVVSLILTTALLLSSQDSHLIFIFEAGSWLMLQIWVIWISFYIHYNDKRGNIST